mgnify:FL=1
MLQIVYLIREAEGEEEQEEEYGSCSTPSCCVPFSMLTVFKSSFVVVQSVVVLGR